MTLEKAKECILKSSIVMSNQQGEVLLDGDKVMDCIDKIYEDFKVKDK